MSIEYIVNSSKPYPEWIKTHKLFKSLSKIEKIFPKIGLKNFSTKIEVTNLTENKRSAQILQTRLVDCLCSMNSDVVNKLNREIATPNSRERNALCNKLQHFNNIYGPTYYAMCGSEVIQVVENKIVLSLSKDVFSGNSDTPLFKKGEGLIKVYQKLIELAKECNITKVYNHEDLTEFKAFSKLNVPSTGYTMVFSSDGEEGAWDIATMSMRGITSCQNWSSIQSRGLIGTISSKYTAMMYIEGSQDYPPYGKGMLHRCVVRLALTRDLGTPVLVVDAMYPSYHPDMMAEMKKELTKRSGLKVVTFNELGGDKTVINRDYVMLDEEYKTSLVQGEASYMDSPMPFITRKTALDYKNALTEKASFDSFKTKLLSSLQEVIKTKRAYYTETLKKIDEYNSEKEKYDNHIKSLPHTNIINKMVSLSAFTMPKPVIEPMFDDMRKGEIAYRNILNFMEKHCDKTYGDNSAPKLFGRSILDKIPMPEVASEDNVDYVFSRAALASLNNTSFKDDVWKELSKGTWKKSFPKASHRFYNTVIDELKILIIKSWKESIKNK